MNGSSVTIHYRRPPDRLDVFRQSVVSRTPDCVVTYLANAQVKRPSVVGSETILEPGSPIVWFTYAGRWHDVGRFHLADGTFTGFYANVLTPVSTDVDPWDTTDLFLDLWVSRTGAVAILDEEEFSAAVRAGWIDDETAAAARAEADAIAAAARGGRWPGPEVHEWTLERVRTLLSGQADSA